VQRPKSQISQKCCVMAVMERSDEVGRRVGEFAAKTRRWAGGGQRAVWVRKSEPRAPALLTDNGEPG